MKKKTSKIFSYFLGRTENFRKKWNSIFSSFYLREKLALLVLIFVIFIPFSALLFRTYIFYSKEIPKNGGLYVEGMVGQPQSLNPLFSSSSVIDRSISSLIYSGLTKMDSSGEIVPDLAEKWEVSEDKKTYKFYLKDTAWHDGEQFFSGDVFYTYSVTQDPDYLGPLKDAFGDVEIETPEDNIVIFRLPEENNFFIKKTTLGILPQHIWSQYETINLPYVEDNLRPTGINLFKFKELVSDEDNNIKRITLEKNENYFGAKPYFDGVTFMFYEDKNSVYNALLKKEVNGITEVTPDTISDVKDIKKFRIIPYFISGYKAIFINQEKNGHLAKKDIRSALNLAINREKLSNNLYGLALPSSSIYHKELQQTDYEKDINDAKEKLRKAGFSESEQDKYLRKDDKKFSINLSIMVDKESEIVAENIREDWKKIGAELKIKKVSQADFEKDIIKPRNYELVFLGQNYGENKNLYPFWHSSQISSSGLNFSKISSKRIDLLLENAVLEKNIEKRGQYLSAAAEIIEGDIYAFFLYQPIFNFITEKDVRGVKRSYFLYPEHRFNGIENWFKKSKRVFVK